MYNIHTSGKSEGKYLTAQQAAEYLGFKLSYFYHLTADKKIPFHNPTGRKIICKKSELDEWVMSSRVATDEELEQRVNTKKMTEA